MGRSYFLSILLVFLFISLSFTNGLGRKMRLVEAVDIHHGYTAQVKENGENWMMMETMDYSDPEPNTNIRGGYVSPPPPTPPPTSPPIIG